MGSIQDILHSAAQKGKIFAKLDCKDAFFQMLMNEDDISKTAITTPLELLEWVVMPHSICNVPSFCIQPMPELGLLTHGLWLCFSLAHGSHVAASHAWVFPILVFFPMPSQIPRDIFRLQILLKFLSSFPICKRASLCYGLSACLVGVLLCLFLFLTMC